MLNSGLVGGNEVQVPAKQHQDANRQWQGHKKGDGLKHGPHPQAAHPPLCQLYWIALWASPAGTSLGSSLHKQTLHKQTNQQPYQ
jgi:hypothetical protein